MDKLISFIIPVYNTEKYLEECINSILGQINDKCEIILVDDGSTDNSGLICDSYAAINHEIKVVHQENRGLAAARNIGLDHANGEYIAFVDSDDYLDSSCVTKILKWILWGGADICFMKAIKVFPDGNRQLPNDEIDARQLKESKESAIKYLSKLSKYYGSSWSKIYKHTFIKENNIRFPDDRRVSEDLGFVLQCILNAQSYDALEIDYYYYRKAVESSITSKVTYKSFCGLKTFVEESSEKLTNNKKPNGIIEKYAMSFVAYEFSIMIWQYAHLDKENKKEALEFLKKYDWVFSYSNNKTRIVKVLYKCLGVVLSANVLEFYMKHRYKIALFCKKIEKDN